MQVEWSELDALGNGASSGDRAQGPWSVTLTKV